MTSARQARGTLWDRARGAARRVLALTGVAALPRRMVVLTAAVSAAALLGAVAGLSAPAELPPHDPLHPLARLAIAAGVMAAAQLARLRLRISPGRVNVGWGEAALLVGLYIAPAGWLPFAALVGTGLAWTLMSVNADRRTPVEVAHVAASLTVAVALATAVTTALREPFDTAPTPPLAAAMVLGAATYLVTTVGLAALTLSMRHGRPMGPLLLRALRGKLLMFVGNVVVGLAVVTMLDRDPRWLLLLPPALWLLQQTYIHRMRADDERRAWEEFAQATKALNQLDERDVASAGVAGVLQLFGAEQVDVDVVRADGRCRRYSGDAGGLIVNRDATTRRSKLPDEILHRRLVVARIDVGDLRVRLPQFAPPSRREQAALSAFGDALAAALHDAATHRELRVLAARSAYEAVHDQLTSLVNRSSMISKGDAVLHQLTHDHPVALVVIDIDKFKGVNETLGHAGGDELLRVTARRLAALTQPGELLGRLGSDEFGLLITAPPDGRGSIVLGDRLAPAPDPLRRAEKIVEALASPTDVAGVKMSVGASAGVVVAGAGTADMTELLRRAAIATYQAREGAGSVASYDSVKDAASTDQLALLAELRDALEVDDQLVLALQPAVDLATGAPTGVEALIRWRHPRRGKLNPVDFVRAVEGSDLLGPFTRYVIDKALSVAADWAGHDLDVPISVNLSARSLLDPRLPAEVAELLRRHGVPAHRLVLEITETVVMSELEVIDEVLGALQLMGVQLAVDDFGTGFSSLSFLTRIPVNELKVDRSFVIRMIESPEAAAIVRATVDLGRGLGLRVVAEGVETADQRAVLAELGCSAAQGYHFFKPMPSDKIVTVLRSLLDSAQVRVYPLRADGVS